MERRSRWKPRRPAGRERTPCFSFQLQASELLSKLAGFPCVRMYERVHVQDPQDALVLSLMLSSFIPSCISRPFSLSLYLSLSFFVPHAPFFLRPGGNSLVLPSPRPNCRLSGEERERVVGGEIGYLCASVSPSLCIQFHLFHQPQQIGY